jgi:hypothetical protein
MSTSCRKLDDEAFNLFSASYYIILFEYMAVLAVKTTFFLPGAHFRLVTFLVIGVLIKAFSIN